ncbi:hypothetical protein NIES4071_68740 [Calothrix sp. NIES-4071]|nr:hypothetical protein NIES4071_68740 [Calothrix sp. NIES-4071]BAZ61152.1 hypothetical protein NIES4105_68700 [Calothrix sp. NIES-4105]
MTTTIKQKLTFEQFLEQCPEEGLYELVDGEIVEMRPTRRVTNCKILASIN